MRQFRLTRRDKLWLKDEFATVPNGTSQRQSKEMMRLPQGFPEFIPMKIGARSGKLSKPWSL